MEESKKRGREEIEEEGKEEEQEEEEEEGPVVYEVSGDIDFSRAGTRVVLLKLPGAIARAWKSAPAGAVLGRLALPASCASFGESAGALFLSSSGQQLQQQQQLSVDVEAPDESQPLEALSERSGGSGGFAHEGRVWARADVAVPLDGVYRDEIRAIGARADAHTRSTVLLGAEPDARTRRKTLPAPPARAARRAPADRRERIGRDALITALFDVFGGDGGGGAATPHRTLRELQAATAQPVAWLKEVLGDIADQLKAGPHRGAYVLKPQYQQQQPPS